MFKELISSICQELNINYTYLSKDYIIKLEKDNKVRYIISNKFDLNGHAIGLTLDDKYAFSETLKSLNIPRCIHSIFYSPNNTKNHAKGCHTYEDVYKYFDEYNKDIVIKPNKGMEGHDIYHITNKEDIKNILDKLFIDNYSISICPYYHIKNEYRIIILSNHIELIFKKIRPIIYGDNINTVRTLLNNFNPYYFKNKKLPDTILKNNEEYIYDWKFNLSTGAIASLDIDSSILPKLESLAKEVSTKVGITFASIDIVELEDNNLLVLEANSGVTLNKCLNFLPNGKNIAKEIYRKAILKMFE